MGLADLFGPQFSGMVAPNRGVLGQIGAGLASGQNFSAGLSNAAQNMPLGRQQDDAYATAQKAEAERQQQLADATALKDKYVQFFTQQNQPKYAQAVADGIMAPGAAYGDWMKEQGQGQGDLSGNAQGRAQLAQQYGLTGDALQEYVLTGKLPGGNQTARAGVGQPLFGRNKQTGAIEPWQSMTDGTMVNIANPQADPSQYDFNPGIAAAERATGGGDAKTAVAARAALPAAEQAYALTQQALASISNNQTGVDQNFGNIMGFPTQKAPAFPGSSLADMRNQVDQLSGTAFLQIRQALKGAGQVTDYEGQKGEIALNRMRAAADSGSKADFEAALVDYQTAIDNGLQLLRQTAQGGYSAGSPAVSGQQPGGQTSGGLSWSIEP